MIKRIQHATASFPDGAKGLVKGILACAFQNMAFMLPTGLLYLLVKDLLAGSTSGRSIFYLLGCVGCFALILLTTWFQYNGTYFTTYKESGTRRLTLAERLRKLPLSFFGKRDLADLTSTIMADCEVLEKDCSHFIPGLFGSLISTVLIALSLFVFDWRMALAALWVIPVSAAIVVGSYRVQDKVQAKTMAVKMTCADGIQEYIETLRDLKASNAEQRYLSDLSGKIRAVEKQSIAAELETALFVSSAGMVLKLGIASVALTGSVLLVQGSIDVLTLFLFLMAASRMYDPMQGALQNLAAVIAMRTNVGRMNEILDVPHPDRQRAVDQSGLRHRVRPCGLCLQLRRDGAAGCFLYRKAGRGHGTGRPLRRRQDHCFSAGGTVLGLPERLHHRRRHGGFTDRPGKTDEPVFHRLPGRDPV